MQITGTKEAFLHMLEQRGVYKKIGMSRSRVSNWKRALTGVDESNKPSIEKMEEMLERFGAKVKQDKVWILEDEPEK